MSALHDTSLQLLSIWNGPLTTATSTVMAGASRNTTPSLRSINISIPETSALSSLVHYLGPTCYQFDIIMATARPPNAASLRVPPPRHWRHSARIADVSAAWYATNQARQLRGQDLWWCLISKVRLQHCGHFRKPLRYVGPATTSPGLASTYARVFRDMVDMVLSITLVVQDIESHSPHTGRLFE